MRLSPIICLLIIYTVGLVGVLTPWSKEFMLLTPFNLLASLAFLIWAEKEKTNTIYIGLALAGVAGWIVEAVGVNTDFIFGQYSYGGTLGWGVAGTPLMMAVNWAMLIYGSISVCNYFIFSWQVGFCRRMMTSILGATMMVGLDFLIEPAAVKYDFWQWEDASAGVYFTAPLQNYLAWWVISFVLIFLLQPLFLRSKNNAGWVLLALQAVFFGVLYFR